MGKRSATPVRFDPSVADRLASFVAANPGMSLSSAANRLVDEALRMAEHPGVIFRSGPTGRRAALAGGPDVWEVVRAVKSARSAEPEGADDSWLGGVADNPGAQVGVHLPGALRQGVPLLQHRLHVGAHGGPPGGDCLQRV